MQAMQKVLALMARLRDPVSGCPWDLQQTFATIAPFTIEEAHEVADAIARNDHESLRDELGDLLLQVVFHAQMADEQALFDFEAVADTLAHKLESRHPHVFGELAGRDDVDVAAIWEQQKLDERRSAGAAADSALDGVTLGLPALMRAQKLQQRAARVGFDWSEIGPVLDKVAEEIDELRTAFATADEAGVTEEIGDLMFSVVNVARHLGVDAEEAMRDGNRKFERRFRELESRLVKGHRNIRECTLEELDVIWEEVKLAETGRAAG